MKWNYLLARDEDIKSQIEQNLQQAKKWHRKAADKGDVHSQRNLAWLLLKQDRTEAIEWFRKAAARGDSGAQYGLDFAMDQFPRISPSERLSEALFNAKTAYVLNDGTSATPYNSFLDYFKKWARFELVEEKEKADIVIVFSTRPEYAPVGTDSRMDCYMIVTKNSDASVLWTGAGYTVNGGKKLISNLRKKMEEGYKSRKGNLN